MPPKLIPSQIPGQSLILNDDGTIQGPFVNDLVMGSLSQQDVATPGPDMRLAGPPVLGSYPGEPQIAPQPGMDSAPLGQEALLGMEPGPDVLNENEALRTQADILAQQEQQQTLPPGAVVDPDTGAGVISSPSTPLEHPVIDRPGTRQDVTEEQVQNIPPGYVWGWYRDATGQWREGVIVDPGQGVGEPRVDVKRRFTLTQSTDPETDAALAREQQQLQAQSDNIRETLLNAAGEDQVLADTMFTTVNNLGDTIKHTQEDFNQRVERGINNIRRLHREMREVPQVDPNHYFSSQSAGANMMTLIAMALGGFTQGMTGQPSVALQMIDTAIQRDIEAQTQNIANRRNSINDQLSLVEHEFAMVGNAREAVLNSAMLQYEAVKGQIATQVSQGHLNNETAQILLHGIEQKQTDLRNQIAAHQFSQEVTLESKVPQSQLAQALGFNPGQGAVQNVATRNVSGAQPGRGRGGRRAGPGAAPPSRHISGGPSSNLPVGQAAPADVQALVRSRGRQDVVPTANGGRIHIGGGPGGNDAWLSASDGNKKRGEILDQVHTSAGIVEKIDDIIRLMGQGGRLIPYDEARADLQQRFNSIVKDYAGQDREIYGVLHAHDLDNIRGILGDPTSIDFSSNIIRRLTNARQDLVSRINLKAGSRGLRVTFPAITTDSVQGPMLEEDPGTTTNQTLENLGNAYSTGGLGGMVP